MARKSTKEWTPRPPRQEYTMTPEQFAAMGGTEPPPGYDPDAAVKYEQTGVLNKQGDGYGLIHQTTVNPTDQGKHAVPLADLDTPAFMEALNALADAHGVSPLSIVWRDRFSPDFSAVPRG